MFSYFTKRQVSQRYVISEREVDRRSRDGRLPEPEFPAGGRSPRWRGDKLDASDRAAAVARPRPRASGDKRPEA
jgi:hypothetical protein